MAHLTGQTQVHLHASASKRIDSETDGLDCVSFWILLHADVGPRRVGTLGQTIQYLASESSQHDLIEFRYLCHPAQAPAQELVEDRDRDTYFKLLPRLITMDIQVTG
ncbi:hypothetical protein FNAPI_9600 [Fusarium napiforme]|uniref:Uncharacterized protein n=1 Tax=Fusarium napiforme TaxID=42672 RepID=A0A8H5MWZ7_9HYPO|nr:hypothetical protein FNAPI_9600 [Fusarium napiforme]